MQDNNQPYGIAMSATPAVVRSSHANGHHGRSQRNSSSASPSPNGGHEGNGNDRSVERSSTGATARPTTCVNGIGMFNSWKRNFKSPFFAMLDIIDNAVDASFEKRDNDSFEGKVELYTIETDKDGSRPSPVRSSDGRGRRKKKKKNAGNSRTELIVVNNSLGKIQEMSAVLEIHKSVKGGGTTNIGENGVGLKQGCAAMSDMSFVFIRNENEISFGIIAKCLQHVGGCYLPSFKLQSNRDVGENLKEILNYKDLAEVASCVAQYGMGSLEKGIQMLTAHIDDLNDKDTWGYESHVFKLAIADIHEVDDMENEGHLVMYNGELDSCDEFDSSDDEHENEDKITEVVSSSTAISSRLRQSSSRKEKEVKNVAIDLTSSAPFQSVLRQLTDELPKYYIHIPPKLCILINSVRISFNYWQRHLVEIMKFKQQIDEDQPFHAHENFQEANRSPSSISVNIFCGFDPIREKDKDQATALSVYIYSRRSGRLIKHAEDGRNMLKLTAGGTLFCQGLTCIIDDSHGAIPLNPTKQDVAFSEKRNGEILGENLYAWTSAIVSLYYRFHLKKFNDKKGELSLDLRPFAGALEERYFGYSSENSNLKLLAECDFSTLDGMKFAVTCTGGVNKILAKMSRNIKEIDGIDSEFKLQGMIPAEKKKVTKKRTTPRRRSKDAQTPQIKEETVTSKKRKRSQRSKVKKDYMEKVISIDITDTEDDDTDTEDDDNEFILNESAMEKKKSDARNISTKNTGDKSLMEQLEQANDTIAKQKHDYERLVNENENLQNINRRLTEDVNYLAAKGRSTDEPKSSNVTDDYEMLMEVKDNLQSENDRLNEDIEYLTRQKEDLKRQLEVEQSLRASLEQDLSVREERKT